MEYLLALGGNRCFIVFRKTIQDRWTMQTYPLTPCPDLAMANSRHPTQGRIAGGFHLRSDLRQQEDDREKACVEA